MKQERQILKEAVDEIFGKDDKNVDKRVIRVITKNNKGIKE